MQVCFASLAVVGKDVLARLPASTLVTTRVLGAGLLFALLARRGPRVALSRADWIRIAVCAHLGVIANQVLFLEGLARTTAINAGVLGPATITVMTGVFAIALGVERPRVGRLVGLATAALGALILAHVERFSLADQHALGSGLVIGNSVAFALYLVVIGPLAARVPPMQLVSVIFLCAMPTAMLYGGASLVRALPTLDAWLVLELAFLILVPTVFAYALNQIARARAEPSLVAAYVVMQPLLSSTGATLLLGERPDARTWIAAPIVLGGLFLSTRAGRVIGRRLPARG